MQNRLLKDYWPFVASMVVFGLGIVFMLASTLAHAADLKTPAPLYKAPPPVAVFNWSGIYLEGHGLYAANFADSKVATAGGVTTIDLGTMPNGPGLGGGLLALYQGGGSDWVFGVAADIAWANLRGSGAINTGPTNVLAFSNATNYIGSIDGVIGYQLAPRLLASLEGGFAFGGAHPNLAAIGTSQGITDTAVGWDVGGRLSYALTPDGRLSVFIKGKYTQLGDRTLAIGTPPTFTSTAKFNILEQDAGLILKLF